MNFNWLKKYMPRSLFGRAVLILVVPIVGIQLFVATIFIQRHFDGVTRQLTRGFGLEIAILMDEVEDLEPLRASRPDGGIRCKRNPKHRLQSPLVRYFRARNRGCA